MASAPETELRRARAADLDRLSQLVRSTGAADWSPAQVRASAEEAASRIWLAIERASRAEGDAVGFVIARRVVDGVEIDLVGVHPRRRRDGIARRLLGALCAAERTTGAVEARLELAESNQAALALYEGLGFVVAGRRARYYPDGEDALLLTLSL